MVRSNPNKFSGRSKIAILAFVAISALRAQSASACNSISLSAATSNLNTNTAPQLTVSVTRSSGSTKCEYVVAVSKGNTASDTDYNRKLRSGANTLDVQIWNQAQTQVIYDYADATPPNNLLTGTNFTANGGGNTQTVTFKVILGTVPSTAMSGTYTNTYAFKLYTRAVGSTGAYSLVTSTNYTANYTVAQTLNISLVDTGAAYNSADTSQSISFGTLAQNQSQGFDMIVDSNIGYTFTISTTNTGYLRRSGGGTGAIDNLSYQLAMSATTLTTAQTLTSATLPYTSPALSPTTGGQTRFPITVKITDDPARHTQGTYSDAVTITLTAQ